MAIASLTLTMSITPAFSLPDQASPKAEEKVVFSIPENAKQIGPGVYDLGYKYHEGELVRGTLFVFSEQGFAKPEGTPGNGNGKGGGGNGGSDSSCYSYIAKGAKWKSEESWTVSLVDAPATISSDVVPILANAISQWEGADSPSNAIMDSFDGTQIVDRSKIGLEMNNQNEVIFDDFDQAGVIAVTYVWGTVIGPPSSRSITEWDQLYDVADFAWSTDNTPGTMDFDNIATHEIGHAVGMGHPDSTCTLETMYAYADYGETIKRDLHDGDITGVNKLY